MSTAQKKKAQLMMLKGASQDKRIFDAGQKRLADLQDYVMFLLSCDDVQVKDIAEALEDECHIVFSMDD